MATYAELANISDDPGFSGLKEKLNVAVVIKATALLDGATPTAAQIAWAQSALSSPVSAANDIQWYVIAANDSASIAAIVGASDSAVQNNVGAAVDAIVGV